MFERHDAPEMDRGLLEGAWRFQLVAPLLQDQKTPQEREAPWAGLLASPVEHPWRGRVLLSSRTLRRWARAARQHGMARLVSRSK